MDSVYFCNEKIGKDIANVLKEDNFRHISGIVRDSQNPERKGYFLYAQTIPEDMKLLVKIDLTNRYLSNHIDDV